MLLKNLQSMICSEMERKLKFEAKKMEQGEQTVNVVDTTPQRKGREPSKVIKFRLKVSQAIEVKEIAEKEFDGNVSTLIKRLLKDRSILAKHRRERAEETVALISRYGLTPRDLTDAGLSWSDWTTQK